ncbi:hypothetical protein HanRHA438_Chr08g0334031 [Helianthus annuus]|nr:hypothetical protein HanRHA438_Chr08g0334031 [Helianthus annuus]
MAVTVNLTTVKAAGSMTASTSFNTGMSLATTIKTNYFLKDILLNFLFITKHETYRSLYADICNGLDHIASNYQ